MRIPLAPSSNVIFNPFASRAWASGIRILWPQAYGVAADVPQGGRDSSVILGVRCLARSAAALPIGCEGGEMIIGPPARELGPFDRLELAA